MSAFDTVAIVDWSAGKRANRPKADAIWIGISRAGQEEDPVYCASRHDAEDWLATLIETEARAGRRLLAGFDFPFGYPRGVARHITGSDDPFSLWRWLAARIEDAPDGTNNRFAVAEQMNACFEGPGPFWGKPNPHDWPGVPYRKAGIHYDVVAEKRACDIEAKASSSCFQLFFNPTVGSQSLMGLPMLHRLRQMFAERLAVWPFEDHGAAQTVCVEIWPGLIQPAVAEALAAAQDDAIRDVEQVRLLARALARQDPGTLAEWLNEPPAEAREEAWILGTGHREALCAAARGALAPPPLRNDCFALPPGVDWTPVDTALAHLRGALKPVVSRTTAPLAEALGRVLAAPVTAARSNPPHANSAVDGYGFAGGVPEGAVRHLPLVDGRAAAGAPFEGAVPAGHAIRILTGAALPDGVDTVVLEEDVTLGAGEIAFRGRLKPGANARAAGEDVRAGEALLEAGRRLGPADMALLASVGAATIPVYRPLRVAILSTGDELAEPGGRLAPGQIGDANRPMLRAMAAAWGFEVVDLGIAPDDRTAVCSAFDAARAQADVLITSGGASAGDEDHVSALLRQTGTMQMWRIAVKPGRPLALGLWDGLPVFGLPGNPVAAMVCAAVFARPALLTLSGQGWQEPQGFSVPAAFSKSKKPGRREYLRARLRDGAAEVFASEGSGRISGLSWSEGLVELPDGASEIWPGMPVTYYPWGSFGL